MTDDVTILTALVSVGVIVIVALAIYASHLNPVEKPEPINVSYNSYCINPYYCLEEFRLKDGTRCIATPNIGIACNWSPTTSP